jgi:hypothetical protein
VLLLASVMTAITPLAYRDLPDQIWLGGFYDGGDDDDAVAQILTSNDAIEPPDLYVAVVLPPCVVPPLQPYASLALSPVRSPNAARAPPAS